MFIFSSLSALCIAALAHAGQVSCLSQTNRDDLDICLIRKSPTVEGREYGFLTCEPNALTKPKHPKARPVNRLTNEYDCWSRDGYADVLALKTPVDAPKVSVALER